MNFLLGILFWLVSFAFCAAGIVQLRPLFLILRESWGIAKKIRIFQVASIQVYQLQEMLSAGLVPEPHEWKLLGLLPEPWNHISSRSVNELRDQGAPVLPTLKRIRTSLEEQVELMQESQTKSAQAWSQALLGVILVPVFSFVLYALLPEIQTQLKTYVCVCLFSFFLTLVAVVWIGLMIDQARFGGIKRDHQSWYGSSLAGMERLWAFVSTGLPPDLAWKSMIEELSQTDPLLAQAWGATVWSQDPPLLLGKSYLQKNEFERLMLNLGLEIKKSIQTSLVEGRGCLERMESIHRAFLTEYKLKLVRKLNLLPNRCLKPLFVFLFPAIFILLCTAVSLSITNTGF